MYFVPIVMRLAVVAAHSVYPHSASDWGQFQSNRIDDLTNDKRTGLPKLGDQLELHISVFVVLTNLGYIALSDNVRLVVLFNVGDVDRMKLIEVKRLGNHCPGAFAFSGMVV